MTEIRFESVQFVVPMLESERGWGSKIDGHAGPFDTREEANDFRLRFNKKHNSEDRVPDYYIMAKDPIEYTGQTCDYKSEVED